MSDGSLPDERGRRGRGARRGPAAGGGGGSGRGKGQAAGKGAGGAGGQQRGKGQPKAGPKGEPKAGPKGGHKGRRRDADDPVTQLTKPLEKVLARLPETQRRVLELRMGLADGHPHDLADTARALGLSLSEAREIEQRAFEHIREAVPLQQLQRFLDR